MSAGPSIPDFIVLCNPENRRHKLFQAALARLGLPRAKVIAYEDFLSGKVELRSVLTEGCVVRIESPGENFEVEKQLLALGGNASCLEAPADRARATLPAGFREHKRPHSSGGMPAVPGKDALELSFDKGRIRFLAQWFVGFRAAMNRVSEELCKFRAARVMNSPEAILGMFDKEGCHARLEAAGIPVPASLGPVSCFEEIHDRMTELGWSRVFIKPRYGSSASGVVAFARHANKMLAYSSVELARREDEAKLYNSLKVRRYEDSEDIRVIVDDLCREQVHVERWIPKGSIGGATFDLRVVVIGGEAAHRVVRTSSGPITNLHLGNKRGDVDMVRQRFGADKWEEMMRTCELAVASLPPTHYAGIDVAIDSAFRRHVILEMNAFGDLLPNALHQGLDTYSAEIMACLRSKAITSCPGRGDESRGNPSATEICVSDQIGRDSSPRPLELW